MSGPISTPLTYQNKSDLDSRSAGTYGQVINDSISPDNNGYYVSNGAGWDPVPWFDQPAFGAVARFVQVKAQETFSVLDFGAVGGSHDDTLNFQAAVTALLAAGGGDLIIPWIAAGFYTIDDGAIQLDNSTYTTSAVHVIFQGGIIIKFNGTTGGNAITITAGHGSTSPKHRITGGVFEAQNAGMAGAGTCIWIEDCGSQVIDNVQAYGFDKAFAIHNFNYYSEHNTFMNCRAIGGKCAWWLSMDPGASKSMATTTWIACSAAPDTNSPISPPDVWYGLFIDSNVSIYRANFDGLTLFPATDYAVGMACNGSISSARGKLNCEDNSGGTAAHTAGILLGPDATGFSGHDISSDLRGVTDNYVQS